MTGLDLRGQQFGRLTVMQFAGVRYSQRAYLCACSCGNSHIVVSNNLRGGVTRSCGCLQRDLATRHGATRRGHKWPEYKTWQNMLRRCGDANGRDYHYYGGRGIKVCDRWRLGEGGLTGFQCFIADMGRRPRRDRSIDRYPDNDGNYEPGNCRWATRKQQRANRRPQQRNPHKAMEIQT